MMGVEDKKRMEEMRNCLKRCDKFVSMFGEFNIMNFPKILSIVKQADKEMNLKSLFAEIKRLAQ